MSGCEQHTWTMGRRLVLVDMRDSQRLAARAGPVTVPAAAAMALTGGLASWPPPAEAVLRVMLGRAADPRRWGLGDRDVAGLPGIGAMAGLADLGMSGLPGSTAWAHYGTEEVYVYPTVVH